MGVGVIVSVSCGHVTATDQSGSVENTLQLQIEHGACETGR